jgi:NADH-quinone oxidoreductase subunit M
MGFVLLGLMTLNQIGVTGAVLQMFSHGIIAGLLFAIVGRIVYDRTHTRQLAELETMHLAKRLPFAAWAFVIAGMASMGLPGFSGFVAELQVLIGAWIAKPWWTIAAGIGIVVGVAYTWRALQKAFFSDTLPTPEEHPKTGWHDLGAITWPEITGVVMLAGVSLFVGLYPRILLDTIEPAVKALLAGGGQ